ncbi:MAG TPA: aminopeptidase [Candidatus Limisoma intestinavium]|uniref:Aminopeptidase n=1 Tax=Candidatus Limisoma intestinavium TaxID=2840856 RepID=A0A9D1INX8_9BACT|nr:aminopeptidase [Candidatus Limisoma intestinavium]
MNKLSLILCAAFVSSAAMASAAEKEEAQQDTAFVFTDVKVNPTTSVKDQHMSGTCWSFSGLSFLEDELLKNGKGEYDLSEMFVVRQCYIDKAINFVRYYGKTNFGEGGGLLDIPYVYNKYGMVPESAYNGLQYGEEKHNHGELAAVLTAYLNEIVKNPNDKLSTAWLNGYIGILDAYLGKAPETFEYNGKTYTPKSFAQELGLDMNDYLPVTSFSHHDFYKPFVLEVPDNWDHGLYYNVPMEEMQQIVDNAIEKGYTVLWAADVSEKGFKWYDGVALMPKVDRNKAKEGTELSRWVKLKDSEKEDEMYDFKGPVEEIEVTQESRQLGFDNYETTDDHGMVIVGTAVDQKGNKYYKVKNSWDSEQVYDGYFYISMPYFLAKTMSIMVNKDAVPSEILGKLNM